MRTIKKTTAGKHMASLYFTVFIFCVLFFLIISLLYSWGTPSWFTRLPSSAGFRFLLALEVYMLSCVAFSVARIASVFSGEKYSYLKIFTLSFFPVPVFSLIVLADSSLQFLRCFALVEETLLWFVSALLLYLTARENSAVPPYPESALRLWFLFFLLFFISSIIFFFPVIPAFAITAMRMIILAGFSFSMIYLNPLRRQFSLEEASVQYRLSSRETELLALLIEGKTNDEISEKLFISLSTVKTHLASIFRKTGARNRLEVSSICRKE